MKFFDLTETETDRPLTVRRSAIDFVLPYVANGRRDGTTYIGLRSGSGFNVRESPDDVRAMMCGFHFRERAVTTLEAFRGRLQAARAGDIAAAAELPSAATEAIGAARQAYGIDAEYTAIFKEIETGLLELGSRIETRREHLLGEIDAVTERAISEQLTQRRKVLEELEAQFAKLHRDLAAAFDQPVDHNPAITDAMVDALLRAIDGRIEELGAAVRPCSRHELARVGLRAAFRVWSEAAGANASTSRSFTATEQC